MYSCAKLDIPSTEEEDPVEFNTKRKFYEWPENWNQYMRKMYEWVVETKGYRPLVIDADDLQRDPGELDPYETQYK